jgi:ParB-like chromosome segregation protein Spo0J
LYCFEEIHRKGMATEEPAVSDLKHSSERVGRLYPVLLDKQGNIIDGRHRLAADTDWPAIRLDHISSEKERLLARLVSNVYRRTVSASEKRETLERLGRIYIEEGEKQGKLAHRIAEDTGMSYRWVMKYLPEHLKTRPGLGGAIRKSEGCLQM